MNAVMLEVAQIALPLLLERCAAVLHAYAEAEEADIEQETQQQQQQQQSERAAGGSVSSSRGKAGGTSSTESAAADGSGEQLIMEQQQNQELQLQQHQEQQLELQQKCLVEEVTCVLQVLVDLQLDIAVLEDVIEQQPQVAACLHAAHQAHQYQQRLMQQHQYQQHEQYKQQHAEGGSPVLQGAAGAVAAGTEASGPAEMLRRQQGHLLLLYELLARCVGCRDRAVGLLLRRALLSVGRQLFA
jgi:hypothetical protein